MVEKTPFRHATLSKEAAKGVRKLIFNGYLAPGERINEKELCKEFGLSRTPLREALKVLESEGLIELLPNRGSRVVLIEPRTIDEIFSVMSVLESLAGEIAVENLSDERLAEIRAEHFQMAMYYTRADLTGYFHHNQRIHDLIVLTSGNETLAALYQNLAGKIRLARHHANISRERWTCAMSEHEIILEALESRDGERLARLLREHLLKTCESLKSSFQTDNGKMID